MQMKTGLVLLLFVIWTCVCVLFGFRWSRAEHNKTLMLMELKAERQLRYLNDRLDEQSDAFELQRQKLVKSLEGKIRLVEREIEKPVYRECVLPDSGVRVHSDTVRELNDSIQSQDILPPNP